MSGGREREQTASHEYQACKSDGITPPLFRPAGKQRRRGHGDGEGPREAEAAYYTTNFVSFLRIQTGVSSSYSGGDGGHNEMGTVVWTEEEGLGLPHKQESYRRRHRVTTTPTLREISSALLQNFAYNRGLRRLRPSDLFMLASGRILYMISRPRGGIIYQKPQSQCGLIL